MRRYEAAKHKDASRDPRSQAREGPAAMTLGFHALQQVMEIWMIYPYLADIFTLEGLSVLLE